MTLDAGLDRVWAALDGGVADRTSPLRQLIVATGGAGGPDARAMVLRGADRATATLRVHSDRRAGKMAVLAAAPRVVLAGYDAGAALQLRLRGVATVATDDAVVDRLWDATPAFARRSYMTVAPPGSDLDAPGSGIDAIDDDFARANFAVILIALERIEWLHLAHDGHRRAVHVRDGDRWAGRWLVP